MSGPEPDDETQASVLLDAFSLVGGARNDTYGPPWEDYDRTVDLFNALTGEALDTREGLLFMVCVKLSRIGHALEADLPASLWRDSITDAAGYLECLWQTLNRPDDDDGGGEEDEVAPEPAPDGAEA